MGRAEMAAQKLGCACWLLHLLLIWQLPAAGSMSQLQAGHTSNWAVLVATSKYWYNYRHIANTLSFYRTVKRLGIPDSNIILMLAEDVACNPRSAYPSQVFNDESHQLNVYGTNVEVDYRGYEVTVENVIRVLTGRHDPAVPRPKRMLSNRGSNVLVYISGHGGNEFMKFQDTQELMAQDVADAIQQMHEKGRYRELLLIVETCQAATLYSKISSPNVLSMASSLKDESSYSYLTDMDIGLSLIDRFTLSTLEFFEQVDIHSNLTLADLVKIYRFEVLDSHFHYDASHYPRPLNQVPVTSFFGSVTSIKATPPVELLGARFHTDPPYAAAVAVAAAADAQVVDMGDEQQSAARTKAQQAVGQPMPGPKCAVAAGLVGTVNNYDQHIDVYLGLLGLTLTLGLATVVHIRYTCCNSQQYFSVCRLLKAFVYTVCLCAYSYAAPQQRKCWNTFRSFLGPPHRQCHPTCPMKHQVPVRAMVLPCSTMLLYKHLMLANSPRPTSGPWLYRSCCCPRAITKLSLSMAELESQLPTMSCHELALTGLKVQVLYQKALLGMQAAPSNASTEAISTAAEIVNYYTNELPHQSWLLTFRKAVAEKLPGCRCSQSDLEILVQTTAGLPIEVVQPLAIGFGTPRWSRPIAAADPAAWNAWLGDIAVAYALMVDGQQQQLAPTASTIAPQQPAQVSSVQQSSPRRSQQEDPTYSKSSGVAHSAGSNMQNFQLETALLQDSSINSTLLGCCGMIKQQEPDSASSCNDSVYDLADFLVNLACSMRWANVNVDDDKLRAPAFLQLAVDCLNRQLLAEHQRGGRVQQQQQQQQQQASSVSQPGWQQQPLHSQEEQQQQPQLPHGQQQQPPKQSSALQQEQQQQPRQSHERQQQQPEQGSRWQKSSSHRQDFTLAGSIAHRMTYTMLLLVLPPPAALLESFFAATAPTLQHSFTLSELQGLIKGLLYLGHVPSDPWLKALIDVVWGQAHDMPAKDVQVLVEGLRFFGTKVKAGWLRDATAQLEEFTLC